MTRKEAWVRAAKLAKKNGTGLCKALEALYWEAQISETQLNKMMEIIEREMSRRDRFLWPTNEEGQKQRTAWAKKQH